MAQIIVIISKDIYYRAAHEVACEAVNKTHFITDTSVEESARLKDELSDAELLVIDEKCVDQFINKTLMPFRISIKHIPALYLGDMRRSYIGPRGELHGLSRVTINRLNIAGIFDQTAQLDRRIEAGYAAFFNEFAETSFPVGSDQHLKTMARTRLRLLLSDATALPRDNDGLFIRKLMKKHDAILARSQNG